MYLEIINVFLYDSDDYYRTDEDFRVPLLEYLVGLYQTLSDMIGSVFNQIKDQSKIDSLVEEVMIYENHYYTSKSLFILFNEVVRLSTELNKLLKEGQKENLKPQVQFFVNELKKLVSLIRFVEGKYKLDKEEIKSIFPVIDNTLKLMDGSIKAEGKRSRCCYKTNINLFNWIVIIFITCYLIKSLKS